MRILCLNSKNQLSPSLAELFLQFSPRLSLRPPHWLFMEISTTSAILGGETQVLKKVLACAERYIGPSQVTISDTAYGAEALSFYHKEFLSLPRREIFDLESLPIESLQYFRGLEEIASVRQLDDIISLLKRLGLKRLRDLQSIPVESWRQRWNTLGEKLWQRLHAREEQVISFFEPTEAFCAYAHFDQGINLSSHLMIEIRKSLELLLARLEARGRWVQNFNLILICEYSDQKYEVTITPATASNDLELLMRLLELRFENLNFNQLENPVREYEIFIADTERKNLVQLDFFNTHSSSSQRFDRLISLLKQAELASGFLTTLPHLLPERGFCFQTSDNKTLTPPATRIEIDTSGARREREAYSQSLNQSPRPALLLEKPEKLSLGRVRKLQFMSRFPFERIEDLWWDDHQRRDYYVARDASGAWLWIYQDLKNQDYFLHGYFD